MLTDPDRPEMSRIVRHGHYADPFRVEACAEVFESLPAIAPRIGHHVLALDMEQVKAEKGRQAVRRPRASRTD
jgi:hypothetical protein